jgi:hypothetical protein
MDYGQPVQFGVFLTPDASQPSRTFVIGGIEDPDALVWFASDVIPAVREPVAGAR